MLSVPGGGSTLTRWRIYNMYTVVDLRHVHVPFNCPTDGYVQKRYDVCQGIVIPRSH